MFKKLLSMLTHKPGTQGHKSESNIFDEILTTAEAQFLAHWPSVHPHYPFGKHSYPGYGVKALPIFESTKSDLDHSTFQDFILYCTRNVVQCKNPNENTDTWLRHLIWTNFIREYIQSGLLFNGINLEKYYLLLMNHADTSWNLFSTTFPSLLRSVEKVAHQDGFEQEYKKPLLSMSQVLMKMNHWAFNNKDIARIQTRVQSLFPDTSSGVLKIIIPEDTSVAKIINGHLESMPSEQQQLWFPCIQLALKATTARPSQKFMASAKKLIGNIGQTQFHEYLTHWFAVATEEKPTPNGYVSNYLGPLTIDALKGLVWMSALTADTQMYFTLRKLAMRCYEKIPNIGLTCKSLGNACLYAFFHADSAEGITQLSQLRLKIKDLQSLKIINEYLSLAAQKRGITLAEVEEMSVPDFGLVAGSKTIPFQDYSCTLTFIGPGKSELNWFNKHNQPQKSVPSFVKEYYKQDLLALKLEQKQLDQTSAAQRDRLDQLFRSQRIMTLEYFTKNYLHHGLLNLIVNKMIWVLGSEPQNQTLAMYLNGNWYDVNYEILEIRNFHSVQLWHPVRSSTSTVQAWRNLIQEYQIKQPLKQAYREVYILTDAEIRTNTYSNRMAAHLLKQGQYLGLAKLRNWKTNILGAWDCGDKDCATLQLPEYGLRVEFWVDAVYEDQHARSNSGTWGYVATDQVRFANNRTNEVLSLADIPVIVFSEVMRDVDLFVGVASVGNDPTWRDSGGVQHYREYWQTYSFGDLSESAKTRKEILDRVMPRLKIANQTTVTDKFVIVKGKLRTYKIHIGSSNIMMEPNDQYLCIVADRSKTIGPNTDKLFIPFEGDSVLSVIISKALLLADDDKITDSTITSQIKRQ